MNLTRRSFLRTHAAVPFVVRAAAALQADAAGTVLVVLQLAGGNDGLNTVVPYEDDEYGRRRSTLRLDGNQVLKIGSSLGFHPELRGFARLFGEGRLAVVQGVGYANMHRDHGPGMRSWQTANPLADEESGWLGRAADRAADEAAGNVPAVFVGQISLPLAMHAREALIPAIRSAGEWSFAGSPWTDDARARDGLAGFAARTTSAAHADARRVAAVLGTARGFAYPDEPLAQSLQSVTQLIRADLGVRIFLVELGGASPGGFDNHSNQAGNHAAILRELSDSVAAFCDDLARDRLLDRVLLMTYSEFGRTLAENGRHGTGHGAAAPVFLAGGRIKPGLIGKHPSLKDLEADAPKPHTDFRSLYATVLEKWLHLPSEPVLGQKFATLDLLA